MIDSPNQVLPLVSDLLSQRKAEPVLQPAPVRDEPQRSGRARRFPVPQQVEDAARKRVDVTQQGVNSVAEGVGLRARQAVQAYSALQRVQEREYVASILGVDEFA